MSLTLSVPGKLILMGEHAVVQRRPGLVSAVDQRVTLFLSPSPAEPGSARVVLELRDLNHREELPWSEVREYTGQVNERWFDWMKRRRTTDFARVVGDDPAHVVKVALGEAAGWIGENDPDSSLHLRIESELPIGGGMGSSAAVGVGVVAGYLRLHGVAAKLEEIDALALQVERAQHGNPSGVDSCTVQRGGVLWAEYDVDGELELEPIAARDDQLDRFRVADTGPPGESTGSVVAAVQDRIEAGGAAMQRLLDEMERHTIQLREALESSEATVESLGPPIRGYQEALDELGVVPAPVRELVRRIEGAGGVAKVSGAGSLAGPGAGTLLVVHPEPEVLSDEDLGGIELREVGFGAEGLRIEGLSSRGSQE